MGVSIKSLTFRFYMNWRNEMKALRHIGAILIAILISMAAYANDGAYFMSGNQLLPIVETDIPIIKERLTLVRNGDFLDVTVAYEFENPGAARTMIVGFEAMPPHTEGNIKPVAGGHPYMRDFTVEMNDRTLAFEVAFVERALIEDQGYANTGQIVGKNLEQFDEWGPDLYVYHFEAPFLPGRNTITHTYSLKLSQSVITQYSFDYVLTAANRWGGDGIGDFKLMIDMGPTTEFQIDKTFFADNKDWQVFGEGSAYSTPEYYDYYREDYGENFRDGVLFAMRKGGIVFQKMNFRPEGELNLWAPSFASFGAAGESNVQFDAERHLLPLNLVYNIPTPAVDAFSQKVLRNFLFARRGYVFKDPNLQAYFEKHPWYLPDPDYEADLSALSVDEQAWYEYFISNADE